jgi:hypothetical protein
VALGFLTLFVVVLLRQSKREFSSSTLVKDAKKKRKEKLFDTALRG